MTVVNVNYRLSPEYKPPHGVYDAYAALKYVIHNASILGIDSGNVGIMGEEGGALVAAGVGMLLGSRFESYMVKFQMLLCPQIGDLYMRGEPLANLNEVEKANLAW